MAWQKKYPMLAGMIGSPTTNQAGPTIAPVGESQPALATHSMSKDLMPQSVPSQLPAVPKLAAQPNMDEDVKKRALQNIAMGHKGF